MIHEHIVHIIARYTEKASFSSMNVAMYLVYLLSGVLGVEDSVESEQFEGRVFCLWFPKLDLSNVCGH